ncbi:hypothetical protein [Escherichia coli]|uniref:hypothetical protein n=1 Tax=Escherichia coli TaxID=562 RepID=UPI001BB1922D|nr:hypothetical protein [Escherichia coli]
MSYGAQVWSPSRQEMVNALAPVYYLDYLLPLVQEVEHMRLRRDWNRLLHNGRNHGKYTSLTVSGNTISWSGASGNLNIGFQIMYGSRYIDLTEGLDVSFFVSYRFRESRLFLCPAGQSLTPKFSRSFTDYFCCLFESCFINSQQNSA